MQEDPVPPREIMPSIPEALEEIVMHAMERDPARRYQSAAEMIKDIDTFKLNPSVVFGYKNSPVPIPVADNNNKYFDDEHRTMTTMKNMRTMTKKTMTRKKRKKRSVLTLFQYSLL